MAATRWTPAATPSGYVTGWAGTAVHGEQSSITEVVHRTGTRLMDAGGALVAAASQAGEQQAAIRARVERAAARTDTARTDDQTLTTGAETQDQIPQIRAALDAAQSFYRAQYSRPASWASIYAAERGIARAADSHEYGQAPASWTALVDHLRDAGHDDTHIEAAGLVCRARTGNLVGRFRDRVTIPIADHNNQLIGFVGGLNPARDEDRYNPKYLNTPETAQYHKGSVLIGLGENRGALTRGAQPVIVEGPFDAAAIDQTGRGQYLAVAPGGTALTADQASALTTACPNHTPIRIAFDAVQPGRAATQKAWRIITDSGHTDVTAVELPAGADPADLTTNQRHDHLYEAVNSARPAGIVVAADQLADNPPRQLAAYRELLRDLHRIPADTQGSYTAHLTSWLHIAPDIAIEEATNAATRYNEASWLSQIHDRAEQLTAGLNAPVETDNPPAASISSSQELILGR